jgi:hypothetical protein
MRNILAFLAATVLVLAGAGWYLDWYKLSFVPGKDGHRSVTIDVNSDKVKEDVTKGKEELGEIIHKDKQSDANKSDDAKDEKKLEIKSGEFSVPLRTFPNSDK